MGTNDKLWAMSMAGFGTYAPGLEEDGEQLSQERRDQRIGQQSRRRPERRTSSQMVEPAGEHESDSPPQRVAAVVYVGVGEQNDSAA